VYSSGKVGCVATRWKDAASVEGELTGTLTCSSEGMAVRQLTMLQGAPIYVARFRGAPGHQHREENKPDVMAHWEG
jgi:hypothetical protein